MWCRMTSPCSFQDWICKEPNIDVTSSFSRNSSINRIPAMAPYTATPFWGPYFTETYLPQNWEWALAISKAHAFSSLLLVLPPTLYRRLTNANGWMSLNNRKKPYWIALFRGVHLYFEEFLFQNFNFDAWKSGSSVLDKTKTRENN